VALRRKLTTAYKHGHFSGLIRICGTSPTLQALTARFMDHVPLLVLGQCDSWDAAGKRIETIPAQAAIDELHEKDEKGRTKFATAVIDDAPVELLESMVKLGEQDTKERMIAMVCDKDEMHPLELAAIHRTDTAAIKQLARKNPGGLSNALQLVTEYNKKSTLFLLRKCLAAWQQGNPSALIDLCGESNQLLENKVYMEEHPVHHVASCASDLSIIKPLIREHDTELLIKSPCSARRPST